MDTSYKPAIGYMEIVEQRNAATLLPIIQSVARPGSIIHSDQWRAYRGIQGMGFAHKTVIHSVNFVEPDGTHSNSGILLEPKKDPIKKHAWMQTNFPALLFARIYVERPIWLESIWKHYFAYEQFLFSINLNWPISVISLFNVWTSV